MRGRFEKTEAFCFLDYNWEDCFRGDFGPQVHYEIGDWA